MATKFTHRKTFDHDVDQVFSAFTDKEAINALLADIGGNDAALLEYKPSNGEVAYKLRQGVPSEKLPSVVRKLHSGDLMVHRAQTWTRTDEGATVKATADVTGVPGSITADSKLVPTSTGSELIVDATVSVSIPLIGGKIEKALADKVDYLLSKEDEFVAGYLTRA